MALIGLLGLSLGTLWWQAPAVLNWGLTQFLQQQGLTKVAVQVGDVSLSRVTINRLDATYVEPDTELRIQLKQVSLDYSLALLIKGQAERVVIESAVLKLDHRPNSQVSNPPTLPSIELLLAAYDAVDTNAFPITTIKLPEISLSHNLASASVITFDTIKLRAELSKAENEIAVRLLFADQHAVHWTGDKSSGWHIRYFDKAAQAERPLKANRRQAAFIGSLKQIDQSLVFRADLKPELAPHLSLFAGHLDDSIDLAEMIVSGTIKGSQTTSGLAISSAIQISDLEREEISVQTLTGKFDVQIAQTRTKSEQSRQSWKLEITFNSYISLGDASAADWRADTVELSADGDLGLTEKAAKFAPTNLSLSIGKMQQASELELSNTSFVGTTSAEIVAQHWQFDLAESWQLRSQYGRFDETELPQGLSLRSTRPLRIKGTIDSVSQGGAQTGARDVQMEADAEFETTDSILLEETSLEIEIPVVQNISISQRVYPGDASLQISDMRFAQGQVSARGSLQLPEVLISEDPSRPVKTPNQQRNHQEGNWRLANLNQSFELKNEVLISRGSVESVERNLHMETVSEHDFKQQRGDVDFLFESIKFKDAQRLAQLTSPLELPIAVVTGELGVSGQARWAREGDQWQAAVDVDTQISNVGGAYDETYFSGASGRVSLQVYPAILSRKPQRLTIAHVDAGVANTDVVIEFNVRPSNLGDLPVVELLQAQTQLLQGSMSLAPSTYDLNRAQHKLQVVLENIDLGELVRLQQLDDIQATGLVTGQLPVVFDDGQVSIDNGQLRAIAPGGTLRYQADAEALQANEYAETVMLALRNFNYDVLRADTQYQPDGNLLLKLQLQGNNPEFEQGRQVNLNVNLEQNVLKLFESLRLIEGVSDTLDKRVQDFYQQTTSQ